MKGKKGLKWMGSTFAALCILLLASTIQSCDETNASLDVTPASVVAAPQTSESTQTTAEEHENPIAGKSMILNRAYDAETKTNYTFDANNPDDRFLLVPSKLRSGHMIQASKQRQKTAGREFTERFYGGNSQYDANLIDDGEYMVSDEKGNTLWFREWKGAPIFDESKLKRPEKGATVANTQIICWWDFVCHWSTDRYYVPNYSPPVTCYNNCPYGANETCCHEGNLPNAPLEVCHWVLVCSEYIDVIG